MKREITEEEWALIQEQRQKAQHLKEWIELYRSGIGPTEIGRRYGKKARHVEHAIRKSGEPHRWPGIAAARNSRKQTEKEIMQRIREAKNARIH